MLVATFYRTGIPRGNIEGEKNQICTQHWSVIPVTVANKDIFILYPVRTILSGYV